MRSSQRVMVVCVLAVLAFAAAAAAQDAAIVQKLAGFDAYMQKILKDWNAPAVGVGIVVVVIAGLVYLFMRLGRR